MIICRGFFFSLSFYPTDLLKTIIFFIIGSVISLAGLDKNVRTELKEYALRLGHLVDKLQDDLGERNTYNNHRTIRGKSRKDENTRFSYLKFHIIYQFPLLFDEAVR
jgi:hypothetical protein